MVVLFLTKSLWPYQFTHKDRHAADYDSSDVTTEVTRDTLQRVRAMSTSSPANGATAAANQFAPKLSTITEAQSPKNVKPVTPKAVTPKPATPKAAPTPKVATPKASTPAKAAASPAVRAGMPIDLLKGIQAKRRSLQLLCSVCDFIQFISEIDLKNNDEYFLTAGPQGQFGCRGGFRRSRARQGCLGLQDWIWQEAQSRRGC
jgi:hypothetical protein